MSHGTETPLRLLVEVSAGELFDKISILEIKREKITESNAFANVEREWKLLTEVRRRQIQDHAGLSDLVSELRLINETLWAIEDDIRTCERNGTFTDRFVQLARSVYLTNDRRSAVKRQINALLGSQLTEEKKYAEYEAAADRRASALDAGVDRQNRLR